jgi:hypothetical protein
MTRYHGTGLKTVERVGMSMLGKIIAGVAIWELSWLVAQRWDRKIAYQQALRVARMRSKPLLVVGNPHGQYGCGDVVLDLEASSKCPNQVIGSVEAIPFPDKYFGVAFCSHVLEHVCQPEQAMAELERVADDVIVVYPWIWRVATWLVPGHTWLITQHAGKMQFHPWRRNCNVANHYGVSGIAHELPLLFERTH